MRSRWAVVAAVVLTAGLLSLPVAGQRLSQYPWALLDGGTYVGPVYNLSCGNGLACGADAGNGYVSVTSAPYAASCGSCGNAITAFTAWFASDAGSALRADVAAFAADAGRAWRAASADFADDAGRSLISNFSDFAWDAGYSQSAGLAGVATYALDAGLAGRAFAADFASDAGFADLSNLAATAQVATLATFALDAGQAGRAAVADFARDAGSAASADLATAALWAGDAGYSTNAGAAALATYALDAGLASKAATADFARDAGSAATADVSTFALDAGRAVLATYALDAGLASKAAVADFARDAGSAASADLATASLWAGDAGYSLNAGKALAADFARDAGSAASADVSTYALDAGRAVFAVFAADAGLSAKAVLADTATAANYASLAGDAQDVNCTTCVNTSDIAAGAVTTAELGNLAVTAGKLVDGITLSAYDEATPLALHSRSTVVNGTKSSFDGSTAYVTFVATTATSALQVTTGLYTGTSTNQFTTRAVVRYRARGTGVGKLVSLTAVNTGNTAQTASAAAFSGDGAWYTAVFDVSGWTAVGTLRLDFGWSSGSAPAGATIDISYAGTGNPGSGTGALVSYRGNVGVGVAAPSALLEVGGSTAQFPTLLAINATAHATSRRAAANFGSWQVGQDSNGNGTRDFYFYDSSIPATRLYIDTAGEVGINTTSPSQRLEVAGIIKSSGAGNSLMFGHRTTSAYSWEWYATSGYAALYKSVATAGNAIAVTDSSRLVINGTSASGNTYLNINGGDVQIGQSAGLLSNAYYDTAWRYAANGLANAVTFSSGNIAFQTAPNNASGAGATATMSARLTVQNGGNVTVANLAGTGNRAVYSDASGNLTNSSSDATLKTAVEDIRSPLRLVLNLRPVSFSWKDTERFGAQREVGFLAQEVMQVVPEVVGVNNDGTYTLDYAKLVSVVVGAIQELFDDRTWLARRVQELEDRAQRAEDKLAQLEARLAALEAR